MLTVDQNLDPPQTSNPAEETEQLILQVDRDLFRAFQRGVWIIVHETGRPRIEIMNEMVRDFLIKHGC
jgi:hypothetical protein